MSIALSARVVCALAALLTTGPRVAEPRIVEVPGSDSAAVSMIEEELRAFYRDLHDRRWTSIVTHFYPAKVTARFAVPATDSAWLALHPPFITPRGALDTPGYCAPRAAIVVVGRWARVLARRCTGELDEAWFYSMSGGWKMVHLESGTPLTT